MSDSYVYITFTVRRRAATRKSKACAAGVGKSQLLKSAARLAERGVMAR